MWSGSFRVEGSILCHGCLAGPFHFTGWGLHWKDPHMLKPGYTQPVSPRQMAKKTASSVAQKGQSPTGEGLFTSSWIFSYVELALVWAFGNNNSKKLPESKRYTKYEVTCWNRPWIAMHFCFLTVKGETLQSWNLSFRWHRPCSHDYDHGSWDSGRISMTNPLWCEENVAIFHGGFEMNRAEIWYELSQLGWEFFLLIKI